MRTSSRVKQSALRSIAVLALVFSFTTGCAISPRNQPATSGPQLLVTMTVAGKINPNYLYFVLFNTTSTPPQGQGPIPVIGPPWGNGFAAGQFTQFLRYDPTQQNSGYGMYNVVPSTNLLQFMPLPAPTQYMPVPSNGSTIQFQIPLSELATSAISANQITTIQVNFLATDRIPIDPNDQGTKLFDAIGDARQNNLVNDPITIGTIQAGTYSNSALVPPEPSGDVILTGPGIFQVQQDAGTDPNPGPAQGQPIADLDIVNWVIEVRT